MTPAFQQVFALTPRRSRSLWSSLSAAIAVAAGEVDGVDRQDPVVVMVVNAVVAASTANAAFE